MLFLYLHKCISKNLHLKIYIWNQTKKLFFYFTHQSSKIENSGNIFTYILFDSTSSKQDEQREIELAIGIEIEIELEIKIEKERE